MPIATLREVSFLGQFYNDSLLPCLCSPEIIVMVSWTETIGMSTRVTIDLQLSLPKAQYKIRFLPEIIIMLHSTNQYKITLIRQKSGSLLDGMIIVLNQAVECHNGMAPTATQCVCADLVEDALKAIKLFIVQSLQDRQSICQEDYGWRLIFRAVDEVDS